MDRTALSLKAHRLALSAHCGMPSVRYGKTRHVGPEATTEDLVVPCEWTEADLVPTDRMYEATISCTQTTDIAPMVAETYIGA